MKEEARPHINWDDLPLGAPGQFISPDALDRSWVYVGNTEKVWVFVHSKGTHAVAGEVTKRGLVVKLQIEFKTKAVQLPTLGLTVKQISFVSVSSGWEETGVARDTYEVLASHYTLVSDKKQYWAAKRLWKSVARKDSHVNVYVWDSGDWVRGNNGTPIPYNGSNISEDLIWGKLPEHFNRLLVATTQTL